MYVVLVLQSLLYSGIFTTLLYCNNPFLLLIIFLQPLLLCILIAYLQPYATSFTSLSLSPCAAISLLSLSLSLCRHFTSLSLSLPVPPFHFSLSLSPCAAISLLSLSLSLCRHFTSLSLSLPVPPFCLLFL